MALTFVLRERVANLVILGGGRCQTGYGVRQGLCTSDTIPHENVSGPDNVSDTRLRRRISVHRRAACLWEARWLLLRLGCTEYEVDLQRAGLSCLPTKLSSHVCLPTQHQGGETEGPGLQGRTHDGRRNANLRVKQQKLLFKEVNRLGCHASTSYGYGVRLFVLQHSRVTTHGSRDH